VSNFLAVATVTATLRRMLQAVVSVDVDGAAVTTVRPSSSGSGLPQTGVNVFLFQVTPNADLRHLDLPTRRSGGGVLQRPIAAIDLHYLFSFYGDDASLEPQRLLGSLVRTLHARPILTREAIRDTLADPAFGFLAGSDLDEEAELVRFVPLGFSLQDLSQIWTGMLQKTDYALSVTYKASVVLLTADERPSPALPVRRAQLLVQTFRQPLLETAAAEGGAGLPVTVGATVRLTGQRLLAPVVRVRVMGQEIVPSDIGDSTDTEIRFVLGSPALDPDELRAGVAGVQVLHPFLIGSPPEQRAGVESNVIALVVRPRITAVEVLPSDELTSGGGPLHNNLDLGVDDRLQGRLRLTFEPPLGVAQKAIVLLNPVPGSASASAESYAIPVPNATEVTAQVEAPFDVATGRYLVRFQVDGAESPLDTDEDSASPTFGQFVGPVADLTGDA